MIKRVQILFQQSRFKEAKEILESFLDQNPDHFYGQYLYAICLLTTDEKGKARAMTERLMAEDPGNTDIMELAIKIELADEKYEIADSISGQLLSLDAENSEAHYLMAQAKYGQRNFDRAMESVEDALSLEPENINALNLKILLGGLIGRRNVTNEAIAEALALDPEQPSTIANQGLQLLREGKTKEALERLEYALSLDPTNAVARYAMTEALKTRFWPYRMFFKFKEYSSRLSGGNAWGLILGSYILLQVIRKISDSVPQLVPVVYIIVGLFLLTWILDPLMNLYLLTNKYGRLLLDESEKKMASLCGMSLTLGVLTLITYYFFTFENILILGILFFLFMIPLGTFLHVRKKGNRKKITYFTIAIVSSGIIGGILNFFPLMAISGIGIFIYQWVINGILIKENARVFD